MLRRNYLLECLRQIGRSVGTHWTICWSRLDDEYFDFIGGSDLIERTVDALIKKECQMLGFGWSDGPVLEIMTMCPCFHFITPKCFNM